MVVGSRIEKARRALGLSRAELAERLEVDAVTVWRWENDERQPSLPMLAQIADAVDQDLVYFFAGTEDAVA